MRHCTAFGGVDDLAREQRLSLAMQVLRLGERLEGSNRLFGQMRLRPVEVNPRNVDGEAREPLGIVGEQGFKPGAGKPLDRGPVGCHEYLVAC
jgi:hypothetical protein